MPGGYVVRDANGQALVYLYSRESEAEAMQAKVLTADDAVAKAIDQKARRRRTAGKGRVDMAEVGRWAVSTTRINPACGMIAHRDRYCFNSGYAAALRRMKRRAITCLPRCKQESGRPSPADRKRAHGLRRSGRQPDARAERAHAVGAHIAERRSDTASVGLALDQPPPFRG
jgi:hypothetical protein